jgi:hypothetical protein
LYYREASGFLAARTMPRQTDSEPREERKIMLKTTKTKKAKRNSLAKNRLWWNLLYGIDTDFDMQMTYVSEDMLHVKTVDKSYSKEQIAELLNGPGVDLVELHKGEEPYPVKDKGKIVAYVAAEYDDYVQEGGAELNE